MAARPSIKLNGVLLPPQMIAAEAQHHPSRTPAMAYQAAARAIIIRTLLLEEAQREAITAEAELVSPGKGIGPSFAADEVPDVLEALIDVYRRERRGGERFVDTARRLGVAPFRAATDAVRRSTATVTA